MFLQFWTNVELPLGNGGFAVSPLTIVLIFPKYGHKYDPTQRNSVRWTGQILLQIIKQAQRN